MDGTTAGRLELARPAPRPTPPPDSGILGAVHTSPSPSQPQFSQLTPVYAPTPTNTPADIPQPPVKGIEFIQAPTPTPAPAFQLPVPTASAPSVAPVIVDQPFKPQPTVAAPLTVQPNASPAALVPSSPQAPPPPMPPMPPANPQPFQPLPPNQPQDEEETSSKDIQEAEREIPTPAQDASLGVTNYDSIATLEKHIDSVDLDQKVGAAMQEPTPQPVTPQAPAPTPAPMPAPASEPEPVPAVEPTPAAKVEETKNYFQNAFKPDANQTAPIGGGGTSRFSLSKFSPQTIRRAVIIAAAVLLMGIGGFFVISAVMNSQQTDTIAVDDDPIIQTPVVTEPEFEETPVITPVVEEEEDEPTTPIFTPTPAPAPAPTPVASEGVPTVANSGLNDSDIAAMPRYLRIGKLGINAHVEHIGVTSTGAMGVPNDMWNAGWYIGSAKPGQGGAVFMDGHSTTNRGALFGHLDTLSKGDVIEVQRNDGGVVKYSVAKVSVVNRHHVDMAAMMLPYDLSKNGLNILSCAGQWIESEQTLENRVMVYAVQI